MNAVATTILEAVPEDEQPDRRVRLRAAAAAAGMLRATPSPSRMSHSERLRIIESTRGLGQQVDRLLADERERM